MKIVTLMENTSLAQEFISSHGLSFYIETENHKILFDMGPDGRFLENAKRLGVNIGGVDVAVLSHGHYDHGGGLADFLQVNKKAVVHLQEGAFGAFYAHDADGTVRYIGLPEVLRGHERLMLHKGDYKIDDGIQIFAGVTGRKGYSPANGRLHMAVNGRHVPDSFLHEQNLLITEGEKHVLIAGCAHNGMVNIMNRAEEYVSEGLDYVIGGMHLRNAYEEPEKQKMFCRSFARFLSEKKSQYYTCHCTGLAEYELLQKEMGACMAYLAAGSILEI